MGRNLQIDSEILADTDMAGPLVFCLALGGALLLVLCTIAAHVTAKTDIFLQHGKVHFGAIYALALLSVMAIYVLLNLMTDGIDVYRVASVLGYVCAAHVLWHLPFSAFAHLCLLRAVTAFYQLLVWPLSRSFFRPSECGQSKTVYLLQCLNWFVCLG